MLFQAILEQMIFLFAFIVLGFIFAKGKFVPDNAAQVLSRLENLLFIPALVLGTFIKNCTIADLSRMWKLLVMSFAVLAVLIPLAIFVAKLCFKENYLRKVATYGLAFSNFAYMGNAVVSGVFGETVFADYLVFCLPLWLGIYLWGVPVLLISGSSENGEKVKFKDTLKNFLNPMLICTFIGIAIGLTGLGAKMPKSIVSVIDTYVADCHALDGNDDRKARYFTAFETLAYLYPCGGEAAFVPVVVYLDICVYSAKHVCQRNVSYLRLVYNGYADRLEYDCYSCWVRKRYDGRGGYGACVARAVRGDDTVDIYAFSTACTIN